MNKRSVAIIVVAAAATVCAFRFADWLSQSKEAKRVKMRVTGAQSVGGRWVFAAFEMEGPDRDAHFIYNPTNPTVVWPGHTAVVEQTQVLLDGAVFAEIPAQATNVFLAATSGVFAVRLGEVEVKAAGMAK